MDTLAVRLTIPPAGFVRDFHPQMSAPCRAHKEKVEESGTANDGDYFYSCAFLLTSIPESVSALTAERRPPKAKSNPVRWVVEAKKQETCKRIAVDRARAGYFCIRPESQCMTLSINCGFCLAMGAFIPIGSFCGPPSCAENIAASPKIATRPLPTFITTP
jgi:hypothetical protein